MDIKERKHHWETIYQTKESIETSWFQATPKISLDFLKRFKVAPSAKIIDVGGGDSLFVDSLLDLGFVNITVLDISEHAILKAQKRLGEKSKKVTWVVSDITDFKPFEKYDFWHDRAAFHFLTQESDVSSYLEIATNSISSDGILVIGTFSENGPKKCSGIEIKQYSENSMTDLLQKDFHKISCITTDHKTPFETIQNFVFCSFRKSA